MEKSPITVRPGGEKDLDAFFELYWLSSSEHTKYDEEIEALKSKELCKEYVTHRQREYLNDKNQFFFIAEDNGKTVGVATGHIGDRDESQIYSIEKIGHIDEICVSPEYRKNGVGKKLMEKLLQELDTQSVGFVGIGVAYKNPAVDFYKSFGFNPQGVWMTRKKSENK